MSAVVKHSILDLFCGCGGLSLGAHSAGFETQLAIDIDSNLRSAYERNFQVRNISGVDLADATPTSLKRMLGGKSPVGVIGGPPCQGFSIMGRGHDDDPRNSLVSKFLELAIGLKPAFFLMENVPGLLADRHKNILDAALSKIRSPYKVVGPIKLNALSYGAATKRERVVIIGFDPNRVDTITENDLLAAQLDGSVITSDAISDLPALGGEIIKANGFGWAKMPTQTEVGNYAKRLRLPPPEGYLPEFARTLHAQGFVTGCEATMHKSETIERFSATLPGAQENISRYYRLAWDKPAPTLRAGTGADRGSYQAARPIHPVEPRVITVREAARLQGFPDWFLFHPTKWHSHRMIGNSVSPIFAEAIFKVIASKLGIKRVSEAA